MDIKAVYDRQHQRIYRLAMLYLKNPSDAEDGVHNVFLRYMERLPVFEGSGHEEGWFVTVTRNYCKDQLRTCWYRKVSLGDIPYRRCPDYFHEKRVQSRRSWQEHVRI